MEKLKASINLEVEINNTELLMKLNTVLAEQSLTLEQFILLAVNKLLYDIEFVRNLRKYQIKK